MPPLSDHNALSTHPAPPALTALAAACRRLPLQGVGRLALPLSPAQAEALAAVATPAPYGKGTATLLDASVRSSLQLEPEQLAIAKSEEWAAKLARAVKLAAEGLGLPPAGVKVRQLPGRLGRVQLGGVVSASCLPSGVAPAGVALCLPSSWPPPCPVRWVLTEPTFL